MEREKNQFTPELLQMMREEEREKFLAALKDGASWAQLFQIRRTIRKLNDMIDDAERNPSINPAKDNPGRNDEDNPRSASNWA